LLMDLLESGGVVFIDRVRRNLFNQCDAALNQRQILGGNGCRIGKSVFVESGDELPAHVRGMIGIVDGRVPHLLGLGISAHESEGMTGHIDGNEGLWWSCGRRHLFIEERFELEHRFFIELVWLGGGLGGGTGTRQGGDGDVDRVALALNIQRPGCRWLEWDPLSSIGGAAAPARRGITIDQREPGDGAGDDHADRRCRQSCLVPAEHGFPNS
jgi:hypothetical protein